MSRFKLLKIIILGNIVINLPILLMFYYLIYSTHVNITAGTLVIFSILGWLYWGLLAPMYRVQSIKHLENKEEYFIWKKWSVYTLLLWPDNFIANKCEIWDDRKNYEYKESRDRILKDV